jgi:DNA-directed RNA polymerase specialized sigma24 family protein
MSPPALRRYRAERLLRREFEGLRGRVIGLARGRLRASGVTLDPSDLDACYAQAWQGLYMALLEGQEIASPTGWLALVTFRRAIEEHRALGRARCASSRAGAGESEPDALGGTGGDGAGQPDLACQLDDRVKLRQLFEGLRARLSKRELEAASLCYLQGFSRSEAAARMGVSEARLGKLMEGRGAGRPGVAGKVGALVQTISHGDWCEEQASLMRGLAYGILDPEGGRYQLAVSHHSQCPSCRAYVVSLRGLAAALPLPPLPLSMTAAIAAGAGARAAGSGTTAGGAGATAAGSGAKAAGAGAEAAGSGVLGAGGAGGGWLVAGGAGAKLAVGCVVAVGLGAGCVALSVGGVARRHAAHHAHAIPEKTLATASGAGVAAAPAVAARGAAPVKAAPGTSANAPRSLGSRVLTRRAPTSPTSGPSAKASREFGIEQPARSVSSPSEPRPGEAPSAELGQATAASVSRHPQSATAGEEAATAAAPSSTRAGHPSGGPAAAEREFGPG